MPNEFDSTEEGRQVDQRPNLEAEGERSQRQRQRNFQAMVQRYLSLNSPPSSSSSSAESSLNSLSLEPNTRHGLDTPTSDAENSDAVCPTSAAGDYTPDHGLPSPQPSPRRETSNFSGATGIDSPQSQQPRYHHSYFTLSPFVAQPQPRRAEGQSQQQQQSQADTTRSVGASSAQRAAAFADLIQLTSSYMRLQEWVGWAQSHYIGGAGSVENQSSSTAETERPSRPTGGYVPTAISASQPLRPASPSPATVTPLSHVASTNHHRVQRRSNQGTLTSRGSNLLLPRPVPPPNIFSAPHHPSQLFQNRSNGRGSAFSKKVVCNLHCTYCQRFLCNRGMKAILLADKGVELYSTDSPPHAVELVNDDYTTRDCFCKIRDIACLGCGNIMGYHVTQPCSSCLSSCNNGHFWMFHTENVVSSDRVEKSKTGKYLNFFHHPFITQVYKIESSDFLELT